MSINIPKFNNSSISINEKNLNLMSIRDLQFNPLLNKSNRAEVDDTPKIKKNLNKFSEC